MKIQRMMRQIAPLVMLCAATGCGVLAPAAPAKSVAGAETRLRVGDQIQVRLDTGGQAGASTQIFDVVLDENGQISLPLIGAVPAAGKTISELAEAIESRYVPRFYVRCNTTVLTAQRFFYVSGEVRSPGRFQWTEDMTLLKAISTAGGFTDYANRGKVEVIRESRKDIYNYEELRRNPAQDVPIRPGESINVTRSFL